MTRPGLSVVVADTSVLINLMHVKRLDLCRQLPGFEFVVPEHVHAEITRPEQRDELDRAVSEGTFRIVSIVEPGDIASFAELTVHLGRGEAACLVLATANGWSIASDEKGRFHREAVSRLGEDRILGTVEFYLTALRTGQLTVAQADAEKAVLEANRFRMPFSSFREVLPTGSSETNHDAGARPPADRRS
jgi:predicted nucleic acid-binding protein